MVSQVLPAVVVGETGHYFTGAAVLAPVFFPSSSFCSVIISTLDWSIPCQRPWPPECPATGKMRWRRGAVAQQLADVQVWDVIQFIKLARLESTGSQWPQQTNSILPLTPSLLLHQNKQPF